MADLLDVAIEEATKAPGAEELVRKSRRYDELRTSSAWVELREEFKGKHQEAVELLGQKALRGVNADELRTEGIYSRGYLDGMKFVLERPDQIEERLEALINQSYNRIRDELTQAAEEESPYA